jgi:hypothetical protein
LVVETVRDLVADCAANRAVVHRIVKLRIEQRGLKNPRGENDLVRANRTGSVR